MPRGGGEGQSVKDRRSLLTKLLHWIIGREPPPPPPLKETNIHATRGWTKPHPASKWIGYTDGDYVATVITTGENSYYFSVVLPNNKAIISNVREPNQLYAQIAAEAEILLHKHKPAS